MRKNRTFALIMALIMALSCIAFTGCSSNTSYDGKTVKISIDEWIGWQSLLDANGGLTTAPGSENAKRGLSIEYVVMNDASASSNALISGELQGAGYTVNRYAFLQSKFDEANVDVVMPFITNYSNGGDGIIADADIKSVNDLVGKKIAVARYSEAHTLVEWLLNNSSLTEAQRTTIRNDIVYIETADDCAKAFFAGQVDAAATWEPYLTQAASSSDSRILFDTSMSTNLILDGIVFTQKFVDNNEGFIEKWMEAALTAAPMYKNEFKNIKQLPMFELMTDADIIDMANGADLATCSQNIKLLNDVAVEMYRDMANVWLTVGEAAYPEKAEAAFTDKFAKKLESKFAGMEADNGEKEFNAPSNIVIESPDALLSYSADIQFELNSYEISSESFEMLDEFIKVAKVLNNAYIVIEGNASQRATGITDEQVIEFSEERANSIANYFIKNGIPAERIVTVGNGDMKLADPENPASAVNRRTTISFKTNVGY